MYSAFLSRPPSASVPLPGAARATPSNHTYVRTCMHARCTRTSAGNGSCAVAESHVDRPTSFGFDVVSGVRSPRRRAPVLSRSLRSLGWRRASLLTVAEVSALTQHSSGSNIYGHSESQYCDVVSDRMMSLSQLYCRIPLATSYTIPVLLHSLSLFLCCPSLR